VIHPRNVNDFGTCSYIWIRHFGKQASDTRNFIRGNKQTPVIGSKRQAAGLQFAMLNK
jgi:hypothetical protein